MASALQIPGLHGRLGVEDQNILEVFSQIDPFVRTQDPQRKADECPHMHNGIIAPIVFTELMNLSMAIMATGNTVIRTGRLYLLIF